MKLHFDRLDILVRKNEKPLLVIVTGLSGAGRSVAIKALEDIGFYCIDNLPVALLDSSISFIHTSENKAFALGMDIRDSRFAKDFIKLKDKLKESMRIEVVFLTAEEETLVNRYKSTRRRHPLISTGGDLVPAIRREQDMLDPVEKAADVVYDTSPWSPHF